MESNNLYKNGIPQFNGQKYAFWSIKMKTCIQAQGFEIWQSIIDGYNVEPLRGGGGESVVTVLKQLCPFKTHYITLNDNHNITRK
jgi:hypothetical protein